jgi:riboflavin kinase/FMN adenylyltransferase
MQTYTSLDHFPAESPPVVLAIGAFDGIHLGHRKVIGATLERAAQTGGQSWVLAFDPNPKCFLRPERAPLLLALPEQRDRQLEGLGIDGFLLLPFNNTIAQLSPEAFIDLLHAALPLAGIVVGENFRFGHKAAGNINLLRRLATERGLFLVTPEPAHYQEKPVSSTRIRQAIREAQITDATAMLTRPYRIRGEVIPGKQIGRSMGFPTANVHLYNEILPPPGSYAVEALVNNRRYPAAGYVNPWAEDHMVEVYLIDDIEELYGETMEVDFIAHVRKDKQFSEVEELKQQIERDVETVRRILEQKT